MRNIKLILGLGVMTALVPAIAMTASASAASFLASAKEKLLAENVGTLIFKTDSGTIECSKINILAGETSVTETTEQLALVDYQQCKAFAFVEIQVSPADFDYLASGEVDLLKLVKIFIPATGCEISIPEQKVSRVDYQTKGNNLLVQSLITGVHYDSGPACTTPGKLTNGTSQNLFEVMIPHGTLSFMQ